MSHRVVTGLMLSLLIHAPAGCGESGRGRGGGDGGGEGSTGDGGAKDAGPSKQPFQMATVIVPGAPADSPTKFGGPSNGGLAPAVVYPPDGVLVPPNLSELEVQWRAQPGTDLFELAFVSPSIDLRVYTPCVPAGTGCGYLPDEPTWGLLSQQGRGDTVKVTIKATSLSGGPVGTTAERALSFGDEDLLGGLYYWAAASGAIKRYDFGKRGQLAENFYTPQSAGAMCVGCHALSRDGTKIAVGLNIPSPATLRVLDVASKNKLFEVAGGAPTGGGGSNFEALSPDGSKVLTTESKDLTLRDSTSGMVLAQTAIADGSMPDWSADGSRVVFSRTGVSTPCFGGFCATSASVSDASLFVATVSGTTFGAPSLLVQGGAMNNNYYPAFSPDGSMVAFNRATANSMDAPDARVMVVRTAPGGLPVDLGAVNAKIGNSWPKFAPFTSHFQGKTIFWLTFSTRRDYGLRIDNESKAKDYQVSQLWMVAVSPDRTEIPNDPGYPAFWLPFQEPTTGNHIAQWTEKVARMPCSPGPDNSGCPVDEMCVNGECVPNKIQ